MKQVKKSIQPSKPCYYCYQLYKDLHNSQDFLTEKRKRRIVTRLGNLHYWFWILTELWNSHEVSQHTCPTSIAVWTYGLCPLCLSMKNYLRTLSLHNQILSTRVGTQQRLCTTGDFNHFLSFLEWEFYVWQNLEKCFHLISLDESAPPHVVRDLPASHQLRQQPVRVQLHLQPVRIQPHQSARLRQN